MEASRRTSTRLSSFALVLAGTFGMAYAIGERLPGHNHSSRSTTPSHDHESNPTGNVYQLVTEQISDASATFHLQGSDGETVTDFASAHGALLHAVVVRPDLSGFQHVHPTIEDDGSWTVAINEPGQWHLVFESTPVADGAPVTQPIIVTANVDDETVVEPFPLPPPDDVVEIDGLVVTRNGFAFTVIRADGSAPTNLEPYLEQAAHLVAIRQGDLAFAHLHPLENPAATFDFGAGVAEPGTYRLFLQFGHAGSVVTVPFTVVIP
jgi:hypothetical protein